MEYYSLVFTLAVIVYVYMCPEDRCISIAVCLHRAATHTLYYTNHKMLIACAFTKLQKSSS